MKDVAREAGVSQAAVSYAYSGSPKISAELRGRIIDIASRIGYNGPNLVGRTLGGGRIGSVGVIVADSLVDAVEDPSTASSMRGIVEVSELADVALTLLPVAKPNSSSTSAPSTSAALRGLVDGVVIHAVSAMNPTVAALIADGIPAVAIDAPIMRGLPYVTINHRRGGYQQMKHILDLGHRRVGIVTDSLGPRVESIDVAFSNVADASLPYIGQKLTGYMDACAESRVDFDDVRIVQTDYIDRSSGIRAVEHLLDTFSPTAIVATSDVHAAAALHVLKVRGLSVPQHVSVIGFDDAPLAEMLDLTTVHQPLVEKGRTAARFLLDRISGIQRGGSTKRTRLVLRSTTGQAPLSGI